MFQFMLVVGLVLAYYGYAVTKNPRIWGDQGRDAIKEETWNPWPRVETEKQKRKRLIKERERQEKKNKKK